VSWYIAEHFLNCISYFIFLAFSFGSAISTMSVVYVSFIDFYSSMSFQSCLNWRESVHEVMEFALFPRRPAKPKMFLPFTFNQMTKFGIGCTLIIGMLFAWHLTLIAPYELMARVTLPYLVWGSFHSVQSWVGYHLWREHTTRHRLCVFF